MKLAVIHLLLAGAWVRGCDLLLHPTEELGNSQEIAEQILGEWYEKEKP